MRPARWPETRAAFSPGFNILEGRHDGAILYQAYEMFNEVSGTSVTHTPYRGVAPTVQDVLAEQVDMGVLSLPPAHSHIKTGTLRKATFSMCPRSNSPRRISKANW
jgi:tripartite-type tricarboxylate transporter receptor subunit TctC